MSKLFITSDQHFGNSNIIKYCNRPFSTVEEMNETIIEKHNKKVGLNDEVIFLGDFCFGSVNFCLNILNRLNGKFHVFYGNHDHTLRKVIKDNKCYKIISCSMLKTISYDNNINIVYCHYPLIMWDRSQYGSFNVHGHTHNTYPGIGKQMDAGVDCNNYEPYSFEEIVDIMSKKPDNFVSFNNLPGIKNGILTPDEIRNDINNELTTYKEDRKDA